MSTFPNFTDIPKEIIDTLDKRKGNQIEVSKLNCWIRVSCGADPGLSVTSNPNYTLFNAANSIYGTSNTSGVIGYDWKGGTINSGVGQGYRPSPIISGLGIDEGAGEISRKADFSITAFSKEQMEELCKFFLEPGFSIFIEWGWNTLEGVGGLLDKLNDESISQFQSFVNTNSKRKATEGHYDNYLGFITGGNVSIDGDKWTISVKCTGYAELPAFLVTNENGEQSSIEGGKFVSSKLYGESDIKGVGDIGKQRWMRVFNELVDSKQIEIIKALESNPNVANVNNFINFDDDISDNINAKTGKINVLRGRFIRRVNLGGSNEPLPRGTVIITSERYIRFGTLMKILSTLGIKDLRVGSSIIKYKINSENTYCSAFNNIFSVDETKLFIPNPNTPKFDLDNIIGGDEITKLISNNKTIDNSVGGTDIIQFPEQIPLENYILPEADPINKKEGDYGKLDNLYVNFGFIKGILNTPNLYIKDALYQILNGISSAVNGMWNFQIVESSVKGTSDDDTWTELQIHELNFISSKVEDTTHIFDLIGDSSIFINSTFDMNISGAKMNQIIGNRLGRSINADSSDIPKSLFSIKKDLLNVRFDETGVPFLGATGYEGMIQSWDQTTPDMSNRPKTSNVEEDEAVRINTSSAVNPFAPPTSEKTNQLIKDTETRRERSDAMDVWLGKITFAPKVELTKGTADKDIYDMSYMIAYRDPSILSAFIRQHTNNTNEVSPLMPISFGFRVHGISGIARGQKFKVNGIPSQYEDGFFQVLSVKHNIDGMMWTTEVEGGYRQK
jgi:hypothetical protein